MSNPPVVPSAWRSLRQLTQARIALGRAGTSLPTSAHLDFQFDHARARDAVHRALDVQALRPGLADFGLDPVLVQSAAGDRATFLQRPDLGRRLDEPSRQALAKVAAGPSARRDVALVVVDGLSALAIERNVLPFLGALLPRLKAGGVSLAPATLALQGRVALGDEIGDLLGAALAVVLIGERPGLSSPDSMGIYLTWSPRVGRNDADRNCISNVRPDGMSYETAANKLFYLIGEATRRRISGVLLKDETEMDGATIAAASPEVLATAEGAGAKSKM
ncbi:ethanolamine ammonia-lyase subunit EutC [Rhodoblastus acidophilus]|uniref:ethanolamine ammonia-lyase subunit EutC n=1 Tax=Candidatus Rhodoblastus alkanivorans TaxID=2954117 RepID=UPI001FAA62A3|nr:ethanolamine ammonia-lyase subunit EutC [Candidatus Rhodoblastus alkanivorans]MCI4677999.1 ethanolamine ammonia-lyase subunit EutC [Candidatus Rhodoblastus alkanivorans]MDI4641212.1 ethanolamine ammonia-lyase subunit EutC [Rhodoblastus acidophilus]